MYGALIFLMVILCIILCIPNNHSNRKDIDTTHDNSEFKSDTIYNASEFKPDVEYNKSSNNLRWRS